MNLRDHINCYVRIANPLGAEFEGFLKAVNPDGTAFIEAHRIRLSGRGGTGGRWQILKKVEIKRIPGAILLEKTT
jgi:hypothetical protein